ncbi:hypothetical protein SRHO_G00027820 [Serrasalmus rhombeus]
MGVNDVQCLHTFGCVLSYKYYLEPSSLSVYCKTAALAEGCVHASLQQVWRAPPHGDAAHSPGPAPAREPPIRSPRHLAPLFLRVYRRRVREQRGGAARRGRAEECRLCLPAAADRETQTRRRLDWKAAGMKREDRPRC